MPSEGFEHMSDIHDKVIEMHVDLKWVRRQLEGNGDKGLIEQVSENKSAIDKGRGAIIVLGVIVTILGILSFII